MVSYKKKCSVCNKNYVLTNSRQNFIICYECQKKQMEGEINNPEMKKMFDISEAFYKKSQFLRNIKINYLRFGSLTEKQIAAFKKVVSLRYDDPCVYIDLGQAYYFIGSYDLAIENLKKAGYDIVKAVAESVACRSAIMAGDRLNEEEAFGLLKSLFNTENKHSCPHGRPTIIKLTKNEIDTKFGRK